MSDDIKSGVEIENKTEESVLPPSKIINPNKFKLGKPPKSNSKNKNWNHSTHTGMALSVREENFINEYIKNGGDKEDAYIKAGGTGVDIKRCATNLFNKPYIKDEISYRLSLSASKGVADANEVMQYFTAVMRGDVKDQFGLEAPLSERTNAAKELAKRQIDAVEKLKSNNKSVNMTVVLDWERPEPSNIEKAEQSLLQDTNNNVES